VTLTASRLVAAALVSGTILSVYKNLCGIKQTYR
jgi:hypothetical protein